jgi:C4-type Zn-finger protein
VNLPKRVAELELKVAELQENATTKFATPTGRECPICGATMKVLSESAHPDFGFSSLTIHRMKCLECEHETSRSFEPGKGYE